MLGTVMQALNLTALDLEGEEGGEGGREGGMKWDFPPKVIREQAEGEVKEALQLVPKVKSTAEFQEAEAREGGGGVYMGVSPGREGGREGGRTIPVLIQVRPWLEI